MGSLIDKFPQCRNKGLPDKGATKVLLVNSDYEPAMTLKKGLQEYGFKVYHLTNVFAAIQEIGRSKRVSYEMILCDIKEWDTEYLAFAKQIRELSHTVKIFLMSSCGIEDVVIHNAMTAGVNEIIRKPISAENLNIVLQDYIDGIRNPLDSALKL
ncbi:MAG: response regulator [Nitrososphaeraceae archaeon]